MGSISKCQKLYKEQNDKQCEDRISNLPSTLISRILSLLPTKYAVATSVLSSQWKLHWTLITSLDLDDKLLLQPETSTDKTLQTCFANFVYRVLILRRESCLRMFRLKGCQSFNASLINTWVAVSLVCGVQELDLSIRINERTDHVLTMVVFKLDASFVMNVPTTVRMQSLEILHLHGVELIDDNSIYRLICGCPVLDELSMEGCVGEHVRVIHIFAPVLTKLLLKRLDYLDESKIEVPTREIVLDTPALLYLVLENSLDSVEGYLVKNLSRLITVNIDIGVSFGTGTVSKCVTDLFVGISSVQCLHLHSKNSLCRVCSCMKVLDECNYQLPMFHNLTSLELDSAFVLAWEAMLRLVERSPRLETLVFSNGSWSPLDWNPPQNVPKCSGSHLKVVEIFNFDPREEELKMVEYFLKNGEVLEKLIIHESSVGAVIAVEMANKAQVEGLKELLRFPRGSKVCQIEIC
ncbi:hypothetical protein Vadar_030722 [Vaccinium darrowii]|uniref:Uncharacterized protein n=1 Tax=Vaccinium darrowii TaxID=229202 RepID=A0ACB7X5F8_9ERIC|nr:hypothetical protein Vadar_030722 [Vaccinium darrowii]